MTDDQVETFFATLAAANPEPLSELEFSSVFELLAAVLLSAQATDAGVNKATRQLFKVAGTPQRMLALGVEGLEHYIRTIGLYRTKARNLIATCRLLMERHGGQVPRSLEALQALPGVFCAGEMLDWEAPTGGYLLTACYASALRAAEGVVDWLR